MCVCVYIRGVVNKFPDWIFPLVRSVVTTPTARDIIPKVSWTSVLKASFLCTSRVTQLQLLSRDATSLCDYRDGGFPWTTRLHRIRFQVRENCYRMLWIFEDIFWATKFQSSQWKSPGLPRPKKARQVRSNIKSMLICFFDQNGTVHKEFVPPGQTVNAAFYIEVLKRLREYVQRKRPDQWRNNTWLLHHDNACCPPDSTVFDQ